MKTNSLDKPVTADWETRALRSAPLDADAVPGRVLLAPWGAVESTRGAFVVDEESARLVVEAFEAHGTDLPIDFEHQTLGGAYAAPNGQAPAAGWIKRLVVEPGVGVVADIAWTDPAREMLAGRQYRYLSPVALVRKQDRKLVAIHSAALTNKPAIVGMAPIVNGENAGDGNSDAALVALRASLELPPEAEGADVLAAAAARLALLQEEARRRVVADRVAEAQRAGKLVSAQRAWAETLAASDGALFDEWLRTAPVVVVPGALAAPGPGDAGERTRHSAARARAEFRAHSALAAVTSEEAYVADAIRIQHSE